MCLNVFIAADRKLPTIAWNPLDPSMYIRPVDEMDPDVGQVFSKRHVYYVGSHEGCGDGFRFGLDPARTAADREREERSRTSVDRLAAYLDSVADKSSIEIFARWSSEPASRNGAATPFDTAAMRAEAFSFPENELLIIERA
jgi:hypothetical protein